MKTGIDETHWFIKGAGGDIIDLTADQFDEPVDYTKGKPHNFRTKQISERGKILADLLGLTETD